MDAIIHAGVAGSGKAIDGMTERPTATSSPTPVLYQQERGRDGYDILVLDAGSRQSLASARSLGRAGLRVALGECFAECDRALPVLAFRSRYSARNVVLPSYADDAAAFADGVVDFVRAHPTRVVLPTTDGAIAALTPRREQLAALGCVLALAPDQVLEIANDKDRTLAVARELGIAYPQTMRIDGVDDVPAMAAELGFPVVLKPTTSWVRKSPIRLQAVDVIDEAEAIRVIEDFARAGAVCSPSSGRAGAGKASRCSSSTARSGRAARMSRTARARHWAARPCCARAWPARPTSTARRCASSAPSAWRACARWSTGATRPVARC